MIEMQHPQENTQNPIHPPYSLRVKDASVHFGLAAQTLYQWVNDGKLIRGKHYLKIGRAVCIIREEFIKFMFTEDGTNGG